MYFANGMLYFIVGIKIEVEKFDSCLLLSFLTWVTLHGRCGRSEIIIIIKIMSIYIPHISHGFMAVYNSVRVRADISI